MFLRRIFHTARLLGLGLALVAASSSGLFAQIVHMAFNGGAGVSITTELYVDFGTGSGTGNGSVSSSPFNGSDFRLYMHAPGKPSLDSWTSLDESWVAVTGIIWRIQNFAANEVVTTPGEYQVGVTTGSGWLTGGGRLYDTSLSEGYFAPGTRGYAGLLFDAGTGGLVHGWADVSYNLDDSITLYALAYNSTPGGAILAGQTTAIPEPSTTTALIGVVAVLAAIRFRPRRRSAI